MANLKEVRERITSVNNTQKITRAMKLVSASKLKRATDRINSMRPYADKLYDMLANILGSVDPSELDLNFNEDRGDEKVLVVLITSDKGLCGPFNSSLIKQGRKLVEHKYKDQVRQKNLTILTVGKKGNEFFAKYDVPRIDDYVSTMQNLTFENASKITDYIMESFIDGTYDRVDVIYAKFKNAATQFFDAEQFLPIAALDSLNEDGSASDNSNYTFEPEKGALIEELVPKILKTQFFRFLLDSNASEHGSRMVAMDKATENANELQRDLKLMYNRERQAAITKEILEIVGGAAALDSAG